MGNRTEQWKPAQAGKPDCLNCCCHWAGLGSVFTSEALRGSPATPPSGEQTSPVESSSLSTRTGLSPAVSRSTSGWKGKQATPSPAGTQLPVVPGNDWTNRRCPAANPQSLQLQIQASQTKDGTALSESRDHFIISWARKMQTRTCCSLPLLKCYEKEKTIKLQQCVSALPLQNGRVPTAPPATGMRKRLAGVHLHFFLG